MTQVATPADPHWQTQLFASDVCRSSAVRDRLSPRAAYQDLLYGRAVLIDLRPDAERAAQGEVHPDLGGMITALAVPQDDAPVILLCQEGDASLVAVQSMRRSGRTRVTDVEGGFHAWRDLGLPTH
ncbi:rhodanese-like domain-containing protein [Leekyejoonella antrihumi]|uniref:Sulfurtransferase n=1 Tax=Leekyejoonella antrihumi TaxID=1660198 RepID=A0A563E0N2_9MICO|nr:rhodanese-like domain-containing protein [Leekyejoonella antrihumi]TWP36077.1 sulfurtransferase [Leekyejoonella antrihumi]